MFAWLKKIFKNGTAGELAALPPPRYDLEVSVWTDVGCLRTVNEDCGRCIRPGDPDVLARKGVLAFVADGMGGHVAGEVASRMVADGLGRAYYRHTGGPHAALSAALTEVNQAIYQTAQDDAGLRGMGTTCTALVLRGDEAFSAHVGDSRLYLLRDGVLQALSEDHSLVNEMVRQGLISKEEARHHEDRNVITRALGLHPAVEVATWAAPRSVRPHDRFLLCSDGLYDLVNDEEILETMEEQPPHTAAEQLVALAKARGGHDNITVAVLWLKPLSPAPASSDGDTREVEILS